MSFIVNEKKKKLLQLDILRELDNAPQLRLTANLSQWPLVVLKQKKIPCGLKTTFSKTTIIKETSVNLRLVTAGNTYDNHSIN